jgi:drug/metabolite transporter (DMT)-like permease
MQTLLLYASVVLIWGTTWAAIPYQLGDVPVPVSVGYRFLIAAVVLYGYALATGRRLRVSRSAMPAIGLQATLLFSINYLLIYSGTAYITSGLVAVLFSLIIVTNAVFGRWFFATPIDGRTLAAAFIGTSGIALLFWPELDAATASRGVLLGIGLVVAGTVAASLGNMAAVALGSRDLPVVVANAHGMLLGGALSLAVAFVSGKALVISFDPAYLWSLAYLSVLGSAVAFGCYIALLRRIGPSQAAYSSVLFPVVALLTSTLVEDYRWSAAAVTGVALTLVGNWLILRRNSQQQAGE